MGTCLYNPASERYEDFILQYFYNSAESIYELARTQCVYFINDDYAIIYALRENLADLNVADFSYSAIPKIYGLTDASAAEASSIPPVFEQPALRATGRGVIIGFIDTGIDYTNPLFRNADGSTRILNIWDQSIDARPDDGGFDASHGFYPVYGAIYTEDMINEALASADPYEIVPSKDEDGHGTFMASVAAGRGITQPVPFTGAAPECSIAVVKLKPAKQYLRDFFLIPDGAPAFQENDIMAGVSYLLNVSVEYRLPLVICLGVGTGQGSHDGTSPLGRQLQGLAGYPMIAAVVGAGNETGYQNHYFGTISPGQMSYDDVELRAADSGKGFCVELWAREPELFSVGFVSPSGEVIDRIPPALGKNARIRFRLDASSITVNYVDYESGSGSQLIFMRFETPSPGIWHIRVYPVITATGQFHMWLPMHQFLSPDTVFLKPDPNNTVTDPGNASMPITVGAYSHVTNGIYIHSSRGFTRIGQIKPELAAPGVGVQGAAMPPAGAAAPNDADAMRFKYETGTSISAAITAGAAADIFTWAITDGNDPTLSGAGVQAMLIRGANRNPAFTYPGREWGFGTLNLYQAFLAGRE